MKSTFCAIAAIAGFLFANTLHAQDASDSSKTKKCHGHGNTLTISNDGLRIKHYDSSGKANDSHEKEKQGRFYSNFAMVDLGINLIQDNTNYANPSVKAFLNVPANDQNKSLFDLRTSKSINVNIYPWMIKYTALKTRGQRIYISSGIGLQLYNFRYESPLTYTRNPSSIIIDTISFKKDKLALDYLNVPLMFTFKTKLSKDNWLVYGAGLTEGYLIDSWTKQESSERGKVKVHDAFGLADFNTCLSAEIGLEGVFRLFATYQLTDLYANGMNQHPVSIGLRFSGI